MKDKLVIILSGILWGFVGVVTTQILRYNFSTYAVVELRFLISAIILFIGLVIFNKKLLKPKNLAKCFLLGLSNLFTCVCYYNSIKYLGSAFASVLLYTSPIMVMVYCAIKNKTPITAQTIISVLCCFLGCVLFGKGKIGFNIKGLVFGLLSAVFNSAVSIVGAKIKNQNKITINFYSFLSASVVGLVFLRANTFTKLYNLKASLLFLLLCVFCTIIPYILYISALKQGQESVASLLCISEPITANIIQIIIEKQISITSILGLVFLILGVILISIKTKAESQIKNRVSTGQNFKGRQLT